MVIKVDKMIRVKSCKECPLRIDFGNFKAEVDSELNLYGIPIGKINPYCNDKKNHIPDYEGEFPEDFCPLEYAPRWVTIIGVDYEKGEYKAKKEDGEVVTIKMKD